MDIGTPQRLGGECMSDASTDGIDARLIRLCEVFVRHAELRTVEGDRLDGLPWSNEVNAGYRELNRDARDHGAMLAAILAMLPRSIEGLLAKARVISRHLQDADAEPIPAGILADDLLRLHRSAGRIAFDQDVQDARVGAELDDRSSALRRT